MANVLGIQAQYYKLGYEGKKCKVTKSTYLIWKAYRLGVEDRKNGRPSRIIEKKGE